MQKNNWMELYNNESIVKATSIPMCPKKKALSLEQNYLDFKPPTNNLTTIFLYDFAYTYQTYCKADIREPLR